jgi:hypothetical protein
MSSLDIQSPRGFLHILLTVFIGVLVSAFIGLGISAFYPEPQAPEYPYSYRVPEEPTQEMGTAKEQAQYDETKVQYDRDFEAWQKQHTRYHQTVAGIAIAAAIILLILSLTILQGTMVIADGILLGGIFTLGYSIIRGFMADSPQFAFIVVTIGLAITLTLAYVKLVKPQRT